MRAYQVDRGVALVQVGTLAALLLLWQVLASSGLGLREFLPPLQELAATLARVVSHPDFPGHVGVTLLELAFGVGIGGSLGISLGMLLALNREARVVLEPLLLYVGAIPKIVLYPIFLWFLKLGIESKIGMAALSVFFPVVIQTASAAWSVRPIWLNAARTMRASPLQRFLYVYVPAMSPSVYTGLRLGVAAGIVGTLMAETKIASSGVGYLVMFYYSRYQIAEMYSVLILIFGFATLVAVGMNGLARLLRLREEGAAQQRVLS